MTLSKKSEFNLLHHVGVVAERVRAAAETAAVHKEDDNTPSRGEKYCLQHLAHL